ncbi:50S ribosomal protein L37ae [Candidatus Pacearchaeota archaeon]|nr:50S ribosomal protein L37ae [Candidatus Pacearchaeota archaeon]|tara:strand:- start:193 stop:429 length:237 start_codon:yes stop_codon:yes gene_type:complete
MASKTKKIKAMGKYRAGYGTRVRKTYNKIESQQRKTQKSPHHPTGRAVRLAAGIWKCVKTGKIFAGPAYYLEEENARN